MRRQTTSKHSSEDFSEASFSLDDDSLREVVLVMTRSIRIFDTTLQHGLCRYLPGM